MKYIIDGKELIFTNPADAVMFAINNNCSEVQVEPNMIKCKHKGKSVQISDTVLKLLLCWENANWTVIASTLEHVTLVTKD